jgi:hypothetical protein
MCRKFPYLRLIIFLAGLYNNYMRISKGKSIATLSRRHFTSSSNWFLMEETELFLHCFFFPLSQRGIEGDFSMILAEIEWCED